MMHYQVTCVCGHVFTINPSQLGAKVSCPKCHQLLLPTSDHAAPATAVSAVAVPPTSPAASTTTAPSSEASKQCPFCGETILAIARKCKHCGEFLDHAHSPSGDSASTTDAPLPPPVFELQVSQWDNFWKFLTTIIVAGLVSAALIVIPPLHDYAAVGIAATFVFMCFFIYIFYLSASRSKCFIRPTRIETETGILTKDLMSVDLIRVKDVELHQGIMQRILRIGTVRIVSTDPDTPELMLYQIPQAKKVYHYLQQQIPIVMKQRGTTMVN